jgi:hypothetical protein
MSAEGTLVIEVLSGARAGDRVALPLPSAVGRSPESALCLPDAHLSGAHGRFEARDGGVVYVDRGSTNGSMHDRDGHRTPLSVALSEVALAAGDTLELGDPAQTVVLRVVAVPELADDAPGTITGDWINEGDFVVLAGEGTAVNRTRDMDSPGWSLLSGARLHALVEKLLSGSAAAAEPDGLVEESGIIAFGVTLTDLFGVHSRADFDADRVLGHPDFGQAAVMPRHGSTAHGPRLVRDLGGRNHAAQGGGRCAAVF